jgi:hypothetical protein
MQTIARSWVSSDALATVVATRSGASLVVAIAVGSRHGSVCGVAILAAGTLAMAGRVIVN